MAIAAGCGIGPYGLTAQAGTKTPVVIERDGADLRGWFFQSATGGRSPTAILLHGLPGNPEQPLGLGSELAARGIHALSFNFSGTHDSGGEFSMRTSQLDIAAAFAFLADPDNAARFGVDPERILLGGYSYGGLMALSFASHNTYPTRVFAIAANDGGQMAREISESPELEASYRQVFASLNESGTIRAPEGIDELLRNRDAYDLRLAAERLVDRDIYLVGGIDDLEAPLESEIIPYYRALRRAGNTSAQLLIYQADHAYRDVRAHIAADLVDWIGGN